MKFHKFNGAGNDFIIINNIEEQIPAEKLPAVAKKLCHRQLSVGADGLMAIEHSDIADFKMLFYNSDGSEGEMCGNGARCVCRWGYECGFAGETQKVETLSGTVIGRRIDERNYRIRLTEPSLVKTEMQIETKGKKLTCGYVELGSPGLPHTVVELPGLRDFDERELFELGKAIRHCSAFPKGANVNFYDCESGGIWLRTFERGVEDFTYACGTGTAALAVILTAKGLREKNSPIAVDMTGGRLTVQVMAENDEDGIGTVYLTGPTNMVAVGVITDEDLVI